MVFLIKLFKISAVQGISDFLCQLVIKPQVMSNGGSHAHRFLCLYKVSDIVPTNDELSGGTFSPSVGGEVIPITSDMIITPSEALRMVSESIIIVQKENATLGDALFPQTGTYFYKGLTTGAYITRLSKQTIIPMSEEFLPNIPADKLPTGANSTTVFYI